MALPLSELSMQGMQSGLPDPAVLNGLSKFGGLRVLSSVFPSVKAVLDLFRRYESGVFGVPPPILVPVPLFLDLALLVRSPVPIYTRIPLPGNAASYDTEMEVKYRDHFLHRLGNFPAVRYIRSALGPGVDSERRTSVTGHFVRRVLFWLADAWSTRDATGLAAGLQKLDFPARKEDVLACGRELGLTGLSVDRFQRLPDRVVIEGRSSLRRAIFEVEQVICRTECFNGHWICDPANSRRFLVNMVEAIKERFIASRVIPPLEKFLLGAGTRIEDPYKSGLYELIEECLDSIDLDEGRHRPVPLRESEEWPDTMSPRPGDRLDIRRIRNSTDLSRLPDAIPQELAPLRMGEDGRRRFLHKVTGEGMLIWERSRLVRKETRSKFLVCFVADIGPHAEALDAKKDLWARKEEEDIWGGGPRVPGQEEPGHGNRASGPHIHARRLIVDCLRDIARFVDSREIELSAHIFLEPVGGDSGDRLAWGIELDDLKRSAQSEKFEFLLEVEERAPGFFFRRTNGGRRNRDHPHEFVERVLTEGGPDLALFVFLGPKKTLRSSLLPGGSGASVSSRIGRIRVRAVELAQWPEWVEVSSAADFLKVSMGGDHRIARDEEFRLSIIEDLLGPRIGLAGSEDIRFEASAP